MNCPHFGDHKYTVSNQDGSNTRLHHCKHFGTACTLAPSGLQLTGGGPVPDCRSCPVRQSIQSSTNQSKFSEIFETRAWGDGETVSGPGSTLAATRSIREALPELLSELMPGEFTLLDLPCGDGNWMIPTLDAIGDRCTYIGADVVPAIVDRNREKDPQLRFEQLDLVSGTLPDADVIFTRDCLVHLPYEQIVSALKNIVRSNCKYLITTHFPGRRNHDIPVGHWRPLNLTAAPFRLQQPMRILNEGCTEGGGQFSDKSLGVWRIDDIRQAVESMSLGPKLTIGMATYRDWPGVWATVESLLLYHADACQDVELIIVDNDLDGTPDAGGEKSHSHKAKSLCQHVKGFASTRYEHYTATQGTAAAKGRIFELAKAPAVLVIDCHVMLAPGSVRKLIDWFDANPKSKDLLQGPCTSGGHVIGTHFDPGWGSLMWGHWGINAESLRSGDPFEVDMQGCGLFACNRQAWPGFHPMLKGFGPEEFHLHQRIRRNGGRCWSMPWLQWSHRFGNPAGSTPGLDAETRLRGYIVTWLDSGSPTLESIRQHYCTERGMSVGDFDQVVVQTRTEFRPDRGRAKSKPKAKPEFMPCGNLGDVLRIDKCEICGTANGPKGTAVQVRECSVHGECSATRFKQMSKEQPAICNRGCQSFVEKAELVQLSLG